MAAALPKDLKELVAAEQRVKETRAIRDSAQQAYADAQVTLDRADAEMAAANNVLRQIHADRVANA